MTPPEYEVIKKWNPEFNMEEVNALVRPMIQWLHFRVLGIGRASSSDSRVYYFVVESKGLRSIRKLIAAEWRIPKELYDPNEQDFHVTYLNK